MRMMKRLILLAAIGLMASGCTIAPAPVSRPQFPAEQSPAAPVPSNASPEIRAAVSVLRRIEPVARQYCQELTKNVPCNIQFFLDQDPKSAPNAYQTEDAAGQPIVVITASLLAQMKNEDELAFVLSHEAAHHIRGHLLRKKHSAQAGAVLVTGLVVALGGGLITQTEIWNKTKMRSHPKQ